MKNEINFKYINNNCNCDIKTFDGTMNMFIGYSGNYKTTFAIQTAANIIKPYKSSCIIHDDIECSTTIDRINELTKFTPNEILENDMVFDKNIKYIHRTK